MRFLLNLSTHDGDLRLIGNDWERARELLGTHGFDGFELYPVGDYDWSRIPADLVVGFHLRVFPIVTPFLRGDRRRLLEIYDDEETIRTIYGGLEPKAMVECYAKQFDIAHALGAEYVVVHAGHCEFDYMQHWDVPWTVEETIDVTAELVNQALERTPYCGLVLFENLWWPGCFRLDGPEEVERLLEGVRHPATGVALDTGHILNKNQDIRHEADGIDYLLQTVWQLDDQAKAVHAVHLTRSLSAEYVRASRATESPFRREDSFWDNFHRILGHVRRIDEHDAFDSPRIRELFGLISPTYVTFEFTFASHDEWADKITRQARALGMPRTRWNAIV